MRVRFITADRFTSQEVRTVEDNVRVVHTPFQSGSLVKTRSYEDTGRLEWDAHGEIHLFQEIVPSEIVH